MDIDASPPKRVTRARAAAKSKTPAENGIKVATAAAKAKATRTMPPTMTRRRTRADDLASENNDETAEEIIVAPEPEKPRTARGRPRKAAVVQPDTVMEEAVQEMPVQPKTRGRPRKVVEEAQTTVVAAASAPEPARTRGRARKVEVAEEPAQLVPEPPKRIVRGRTATLTKPVAAPKRSVKSVKFEDTHELDKENVIPATSKGKAKEAEAATGLRAKPVRKPAAATRVTRGRAKLTEEPEQLKPKSPLSPKKPTQVATAKDAGSDDELATMEKTPMRPLTKSPFKASASVLDTSKKLNFTTSIVVNRTSTTQDLGSSIMASPARRMPQSPWKSTIQESPKRVVLGDSLMQPPFKMSMAPPSAPTASPFKASLLQSPARRPPSPTKVSAGGSPTRSTSSSSLFGATPKPSTFSVSRFTTPRTLTKSAFRPGRLPFSNIAKPATESRVLDKSQSTADFTPIKPFPGRLSAVLPRDADPTMRGDDEVPMASATPKVLLEEADENESAGNDIVDYQMEVDHIEETATITQKESRSTTPTNSPPRYSSGSFGLRPEQEDPFQDSDSEDELASASPLYSPAPLSALKMSSNDFAKLSTPQPFSLGAKTPSANDKIAPIGFTPLARKLSDWMPPTPSQPGIVEEEIIEEETIEEELAPAEIPQIDEQDVEQSPVKSTFFEDEMIIREEAVLEPELAAEEVVLEALEFAPAELDDDDLALAAEADEMSLIEEQDEDVEDVEDIVDILNYAAEDRAISEPSQEYGDENAIPIDPELLALDAEPTVPEEPIASDDQPAIVVTPETASIPTPASDNQATPLAPRSFRRPALPFTPARVLTERTVHTVSKVPLKPAAAESPVKPSPRKRPASLSRVTAQRTPPPPPANTHAQQDHFTPGKATDNNWSTTATPTRTPRRDLNDKILRGAVVYVDVHTSEGADASAVFVELLGQMGAKCVKTWGWNPNAANTPGGFLSPDSAESAKVGITHVVFKDGGKRTLEKVRESKGVVLCVGVGWVLDCERTNQWLDESAYAIDTALVPRGGHRRRKSMEPRALANLNGTLVSTPGRPAAKEHQAAPATTQAVRIGRRQSTQWVRSPRSESCDSDATPRTARDADTDMLDYSLAEFSPLPVTPAPEAVSAYAEQVLDEMGGVEETPYFAGREREELVVRTVPAKRVGGEEGRGAGSAGTVAGGNSEALMQRLLLARRKSLQWAPKVGSPLARG